MVGARLGPVRLVALRNPELVERVLVDDADAYTKGLALKRARVVLGDGLLTSEGDVHRREALLIGPALARRRMPEHEATMVAVARRTGERWREGREIDLLAEMAGLTLRIVTTALFGRELTTAEIDAVAHGLAEVLDGLDWLMTNPLGPLRERIRTRRVRRLLAGRDEIYGVVARLVADRRAAGAGDDLLGVLVDATAAGAMDERLLRDEVVGLLLAGHETTAVWLSSTWLALAEHPDVDARVHAELRDALGDRTVRLTDAERLPYLRAVMEETLPARPAGVGPRAARDARAAPGPVPAPSRHDRLDPAARPASRPPLLARRRALPPRAVAGDGRAAGAGRVPPLRARAEALPGRALRPRGGAPGDRHACQGVAPGARDAGAASAARDDHPASGRAGGDDPPTPGTAVRRRAPSAHAARQPAMNAAGTISATATKGDGHTAVEGVPRRSISRATTTLATAMPAGHVERGLPCLRECTPSGWPPGRPSASMFSGADPSRSRRAVRAADRTSAALRSALTERGRLGAAD